MAVTALIATALSSLYPAIAVISGIVVGVGPVGLSLTGRTSALAWTPRLIRLAILAVLFQTGFTVGIAYLLRLVSISPYHSEVLALAIGSLLVGLIIVLAVAVSGPVEKKASNRYVKAAIKRLEEVNPTIVAITGSYGKTTTKGYVAHLLSTYKSVVASPASFNNRLGLARAINENLIRGTEVFVAEMGAYYPGDIAELCSWIKPDIGVITAIGPVHLERFGSVDRIAATKSEITTLASVAVLALDYPELYQLAESLKGSDKKVISCSGRDTSTDVCVKIDGDSILLYEKGELLAALPATTDTYRIAPSNLACAVAVALELGLPRSELKNRIPSLPVAPNRLAVLSAPGGFSVIDDTYNSNPTGARLALAMLEKVAALSGSTDDSQHDPGHGGNNETDHLHSANRIDSSEGRRVVLVTPGMIELGPRQEEENANFAAAASAIVSDIVIVGRTNRRALLDGLAREGNRVVRVKLVNTREEAVSWVRENLGSGDVVLYENDLPDHYP